jgi:ribosome biogenesis GTPase A
VNKDPVIYLVDSPGVMIPKISDVDTGLKLAVTGAIRSHLVGFEVLADFALYQMNKQHNYNYAKQLKLHAPTDDLHEVLEQLKMLNGDTIESGSQRIVQLFRR